LIDKTKEGGTRKWDQYQPSSSQLPLISIIIATYQAAKSLPQTLDSVIAQNYPSIELIIIDGASKDETLNVIKHYEDRIDYWCSESDEGVYHAFNKGIKIAKGEWLYFLGAGDELAGINNLAQIFPVNHSTRLVYGNVARGKRIYDGPFTRAKFCHRNICQQAIFYHRDLFTELGLFDTRYPWLADWAFNICCFSHSETKPHFIDLIVANYPSGGVSDTRYDYSFYQDLAQLVRRYGLQYSLFTRIYWWLKSWFVSNKLLAKSMRGEYG
jgi:glycosyltransferase involved in cell wall biosynthesis